MEYNGVEVHFKNGEVLCCNVGDVSNFINWIPSQSFSDNPLIAINGKYAVNAKEVLCIRPVKLN